MTPQRRLNRPLKTVLPRLILLTLGLQSYPSTLLAAKAASGSFSPHCDGASFYLSKVDGLPSGQQLNLNMRHHALSWWNYRPQEVWEEVFAERCFSAEKCEVATHARIWLDKGNPNDKHVLGKYDVDFGEEHLEGKFFVKYRKEKTIWLCE